MALVHMSTACHPQGHWMETLSETCATHRFHPVAVANGKDEVERADKMSTSAP